MKMFRGLSKAYWVERLKLRGWSDTLAEQWASFLVGETQAPPSAT